MPLKVVRRRSTGALTIQGTVNHHRVRRRAQSDRLDLAHEEAAALEAEILRNAWHGERRGVRSFAEAVVSYLNAAPRAEGTRRRLNRILVALGDVRLASVNQDRLDLVKTRLYGASPNPGTVKRGLIVPVRAVLYHAWRRGWCDAPAFEIVRQAQGRTRYLLPDEAQRLVLAAAPHLRPLLVFLLGTGARLGEALALQWRDVDLDGARAIFWETKSGKRRVATLSPSAVAALSTPGPRQGPVFMWWRERGKRAAGRAPIAHPYADRKGEGGGQIKRSFAGAVKRAGLDPSLSPHALRHTWASWHYALHRDLLALKAEGAWSSVVLVERYAHLMPSGHEAAIRAVWGLEGDAAAPRVTL